MDSINTSVTAIQFSATDTLHSAQTTTVPITNTSMVDTPQQVQPTIPDKSKQLQPDQLALSEEAKTKSAEAEAGTKEKDEDKTSIDASRLNGVKTAEEAAASDKTNESDLDREIRELGMEVLELTVKIQLLQDKEDKESVKERRALEVDLAITKGQLDAAIKRKLKQAGMD
ncbi:MAG: hypothetical protein HRT51_13840 [Colwellia sp.]|nr:hypothetical protein [Colwellia sp.]